jgi:hypothetical protein
VRSTIAEVRQTVPVTLTSNTFLDFPMRAVDQVELYRESAGELKEPKKRSLVLHALTAFERLEQATAPSHGDLSAIVEAASCRYLRVWEIGAHLLHILAGRHQAAQVALRTMFASRKATLRFRVIVFLRFSSAPESFAKELIQLALCDRSHEIREAGADMAGWLGLTELLPALRQSLAIEKYRAARDCLSFTVAMLQDGYLLRREEGKPTILYVNLKQEGYYWMSFPIKDSDVMKQGLESIIEEARSSHRRSHQGRFGQ